MPASTSSGVGEGRWTSVTFLGKGMTLSIGTSLLEVFISITSSSRERVGRFPEGKVRVGLDEGLHDVVPLEFSSVPVVEDVRVGPLTVQPHDRELPLIIVRQDQ